MSNAGAGYFIYHFLIEINANTNEFSFCRAFGGSSNLRIPHWGGIHGCLFEYLPLIQELFAERVSLLL